MKVVSSDRHRAHNPSFEVNYGERVAMFEVPDRADRIVEALRGDASFELVAPTDHGREPIDAVHDPALLDFLADAWERFQTDSHPLELVFPDVMLHPALVEGMGPGARPDHIGGQLGYWCWETNTPLADGTYAAARASVDIALGALDAVDAGDRSAYAVCRPPGHHAPRAAYGGYCYFNNAAIVATEARRRGRHKVVVLDVDYHHGNGTQQLFWSRSDVMYVSLHGDPRRAYPYFCGHADETGGDGGRHSTLNLPLAEGVDDTAYLAALERGVDAIGRFAPDLLVVSLGVDTSVGDPLGDFALTTAGMGACGALVAALGLPTVIVQEGGYDLGTVATDVHAWLRPFTAV
ncbi:MAG: histone deacetylase family protein [Acidimicrobiales bacterium]